MPATAGGKAHHHARDLAEAPVAHELHGVPHLALRALPAARLPDASVALHGAHEGASLEQVVRERLLAVDVLAVAGGERAHVGVPVVGRGDHHGVDVVAHAELAEVVVFAAVLVAVAPVHLVLRARRLVGVHVTHGHHLDVVHSQERAHVAVAHSAHADHAHHDAVGRRIRAHHASRHQIERAERRARSEECAP